MFTQKKNVRISMIKPAIIGSVVSAFLLASSPVFASFNVSSDSTLSSPMPCTGSSVPFTPLCLIPNVVGGVLQADIFLVLQYPQRGAIFVGSESEPHIAVNPTDPNNIAIAWMQDRTARLGGGLALITAISTDGGVSWDRKIVPFSRASGAPNMNNPGSYDRVSDPWLFFDKNGNLYFQALPFDGLTKDVGGAITVAKSINKGAAFGPVTTIYAKSGIGNRTTDKPTFVADPSRTGPGGDPILYSTFAIFNHSGKNDIYFGISKDGGKTWNSNKIYTAETNADQGSKDTSSILGETVVLPNKTLVFVFIQSDGADFDSSVSFSLRLIRSFDGGATWESSPFDIVRITPANINDPEINDKSGANIPIRESSNQIPAVSVNTNTGDLYIAYGDADTKSSPEKIKVIRLSNAGIQGQAPVVSVPVTVATQNAFAPALKVAANNTVGVAFIDMRNDVLVPGCSYNLANDTQNCGPLTADVWLKQLSSDLGIVYGETKLTSSSSIDYRSAPLLFGVGGVIPGGYFLGDYFGLTSAGGNFLVAYPNTNGVTSCELRMNNVITGFLVTATVGPLYLPADPNAIAINICNRNDIFFSSVPVLP